jgi:hypothetical protein
MDFLHQSTLVRMDHHNQSMMDRMDRGFLQVNDRIDRLDERRSRDMHWMIGLLVANTTALVGIAIRLIAM